MHDQTIRLQKFRALFRQAEEPGVFTNSGEIFPALAFVLNPQQVHDIGIWKDIVDLVRNFDTEFFELARHQRARPDQRDTRAELDQTENVRTRDATKQNVANDHDMQPGDFSPLLADRVKIEKRLSGMLMRAIAGIDHTRFEPIAQKLRRAGGAVTQHENIS